MDHTCRGHIGCQKADLLADRMVLRLSTGGNSVTDRSGCDLSCDGMAMFHAGAILVYEPPRIDISIVAHTAQTPYCSIKMACQSACIELTVKATNTRAGAI